MKEINEAGGVNGKQVELVKYDNKSDASEAFTLATKLMTSDGVVAVLGPATTGNFKAVIPVAEQNKIPVASGSATGDDVTVEFNEAGEVEYDENGKPPPSRSMPSASASTTPSREPPWPSLRPTTSTPPRPS